MFQHQGIWLPDGEKHFPDWMTKNGEIVDGKGSYQIKKYRAALEFMGYPKLRVAIDVGAHVGFWAMQMIKNFDIVHCFEPVAAYRECFVKNMPHGEGRGNRGDFLLYPVALGNPGLYKGTLAEGPREMVKMKIPPMGAGIDSGGTHVDAEEPDEFDQEAVELRALDEYDFSDVDFIKIDCEGYEHHVISGARETLVRCRPCVIVEQKPHKLGPNFGIKGTPAVDLLRGLGAEVRREMGGDWIMSWP